MNAEEILSAWGAWSSGGVNLGCQSAMLILFRENMGGGVSAAGMSDDDALMVDGMIGRLKRHHIEGLRQAGEAVYIYYGKPYANYKTVAKELHTNKDKAGELVKRGVAYIQAKLDNEAA